MARRAAFSLKYTMSWAKNARYRAPLWVVVALSGVAALCHELLWTRRLLDFLGSSATANARVLGVFFLGLSLGAALASRAVKRIKRPWRALAVAEVVIALASLPALFLPDWSSWIWQSVGVEGLMSPAGAWIKLLVSIMVVAPPAMAMGFTLPLALASLSSSTTQVGRDATWLYSVNTIGAVVGILVVSAWLLAAFGLVASMWVAIGLNLSAALIAIVFEPVPRSSESVSATDPETATKTPIRIIGLAFMSGVGVLAVEVIALHLLMLVATMSFYAPAAILATMIAMLAIAAAVAPTVFRNSNIDRAVSIALATGGVLVAAAPLAYWALVHDGGFAGTSDSLSHFLVRLFALTAAFIGLGALLIGCVFPLLMNHTNRGSVSGSAAAVATLLAANGVGGLVGAELSNQVLLPAFGPYVALGGVGGIYCLVALVLLLTRPVGIARRLRSAVYPGLCAVGVLTIVVLWLPGLPMINPHLGFEVVAQTTDRQGTLSVVDHARMGRAMVVNNQYVLGSSTAASDQERQTHLPLLLHRKPRQIALIGLATGSSAGASLLHGPVERAEVLELSRSVIAAAKKYFAEVNRRVADDSRVQILEEDGRTYIGAARDRFDAIIGDLFLPWSTGVGRLYSTEHFQAVRRSLTKGGVFCQWLPMHQFSESQLELILASILTAFPEVHLFRNTFRPEKPSLGLVALKDAELSWATVSDRAASTRSWGQVEDPSMRHGVAVAMLYLGRVGRGDLSTERVNTLGNSALELDASKVRVSRDANRKYLHGQNWNQFIHKRLRILRTDDALPKDVRRLVRLGVDLTTWEIAFRTRHAKVDEIAERIRRSFPAVVDADSGADWSKWPGLTLWRDSSKRSFHRASTPKLRSARVADSENLR